MNSAAMDIRPEKPLKQPDWDVAPACVCWYRMMFESKYGRGIVSTLLTRLQGALKALPTARGDHSVAHFTVEVQCRTIINGPKSLHSNSVTGQGVARRNRTREIAEFDFSEIFHLMPNGEPLF